MMDPISDMIIRVKNASMAGHDTVTMPMSALKLAVAEKLKQRGILSGVSSKGKGVEKALELTLTRSDKGVYRFTDVRRVSKPGCRVYVGSQNIKPVRGGLGTVFVSTPKGILFGHEARKENVGGEILFEIW